MKTKTHSQTMQNCVKYNKILRCLNFTKLANIFYIEKMGTFTNLTVKTSKGQSVHNVCSAYFYRSRVSHKAGILKIFCVVWFLQPS